MSERRKKLWQYKKKKKKNMKEGKTKHVEERLHCLLYHTDTAVG
jgi:hypothetical protein